MNIHFHTIDIFDDKGAAAGSMFLKTWYDWKGELPHINDIVILHWDENGKDVKDPYKVKLREIDGAFPNVLNVFVSKV